MSVMLSFVAAANVNPPCNLRHSSKMRQIHRVIVSLVLKCDRCLAPAHLFSARPVVDANRFGGCARWREDEFAAFGTAVLAAGDTASAIRTSYGGRQLLPTCLHLVCQRTTPAVYAEEAHGISHHQDNDRILWARYLLVYGRTARKRTHNRALVMFTARDDCPLLEPEEKRIIAIVSGPLMGERPCI